MLDDLGDPWWVTDCMPVEIHLPLSVDDSGYATQAGAFVSPVPGTDGTDGWISSELTIRRGDPARELELAAQATRDDIDEIRLNRGFYFPVDRFAELDTLCADDIR
jgi:hypothetical protein